MRADVGIIGGTGVGTLLSELPGSVVHVPTSLGLVRGKVIDCGSRTAFLMSRHSAGHSVPPHKVAYGAMALALNQFGAKACFASAAVGSLNASVGVGEFAVCSDFLDFTGRNSTLFNDSVVHTPFASPFGPLARKALLDAAAKSGHSVRDGGVYVGLNGPRFETPREIQLLSKIGDFVGMTASTEAILMKEANIEYSVLAVVTNLGEGLGGNVEHSLVGDVMKSHGPKVVEIFQQAVAEFPA